MHEGRGASRTWWVAAAVAAWAVAGQGLAETAEDAERRLVAAIAAQDEAAAILFIEAGVARQWKDWPRAERLYADVASRLPRDDHSRRRRCEALSELSRRDEAEAECRAAVERARTAENLATLGMVLVRGRTIAASPPGTFGQARSFAREALELDPAQPLAMTVLAETSQQLGEEASMAPVVERALAASPDDPRLHYLSARALAAAGEHELARSALKRARALGLAAGLHDELDARLDAARPLSRRVLDVALLVGAAWAGSLAILAACGMALSAATSRAARRLAAAGSTNPDALPRGLRLSYRLVLLTASLYYYLSVPVLFAAVVGLASWLLWVMVVNRSLEFSFILEIVIGVPATILAVLGGLAALPRHAAPGEPLDMRGHPRLRAEILDVAARLGTAPVDDVFLVPGSVIAVDERGGVATRAVGRARRRLVLGLAALRGLPVPAFRAVLAHEHGHLAHADTVSGEIALAVRATLDATASALAARGLDAWYNPITWFLELYRWVFLRISQGTSRFQEILADRRAVAAYGSEAFVTGLTHVVAAGVRFRAGIEAAARWERETGGRVTNVYAFDGDGLPSAHDVSSMVEAVLAEPGSPWDSHPAPADRIAWARAMRVHSPESFLDRGDAASLLEGATALEERMTRRALGGAPAAAGVAARGPEWALAPEGSSARARRRSNSG